jgi:hypothetical protein
MGVKITNNAAGTLAAGISNSATTLTVTSGQGALFPTLTGVDYCFLTLIDTSNNLEIVKCTARSTDSFTIVRAQDNTTARAFAISDRLEMRPTAALFNEFANPLSEKGADIASASPLVITAGSDYFDVTGTTNFSAMTVATNRQFTLQFDAALVMTHHATNLDLPGLANITTVAGDVATFQSTGANTVQCINYTKVDGTAVVDSDTDTNLIGKQTIWVPANAMTPTESNGCAAIAAVETTAGRPDMNVLDFDDGADEHAQFTVAFPKSWNLGTVTFQAFWCSTAADTDGVSWALQGVSMPDNSTIDVAYGSAVVVDDANQGAAEELLVTAESAAITIAGTPADDDLCYFRIFRDVSDANDTAAEDARLLGIKLFYTTDAVNDA